jgi:hypothetical protein
MCDEVSGLPALNNIDEVDESTVLVTKRGGCTFGEKALVAHHEAGAAGIIFVNNQDGLFHPAGPDSRDVKLGAYMVNQHDGNHLIQALMSVADTEGPNINGRFVPMTCGNDVDSSYCKPIHYADHLFESSLDYSGKLSVDNDVVEYDYVQGEFGDWIDPHVVWSTMVPTVIGGDAHCCDRSGFEGNNDAVTNSTAMLCLRGECDFATKAENTERAGAGLLLVSSHNSTLTHSTNNTLTRMGCDPPSRGRKVNVATIMVTHDGYEEIVNSFYSQLDAGMTSGIRLAYHGSTCNED